ncbi:translation initiation factor IF-2-like [Nycticebus coucang]|uniref:translation initiation factor IF-2-like n=1 Tax=Nycticebus coucang TaxID=9470 RepID=UPI00234CE34D|nr:translation initiation factor IF-2-like [Nycticebus coucang]
MTQVDGREPPATLDPRSPGPARPRLKQPPRTPRLHPPRAGRAGPSSTHRGSCAAAWRPPQSRGGAAAGEAAGAAVPAAAFRKRPSPAELTPTHGDVSAPRQGPAATAAWERRESGTQRALCCRGRPGRPRRPTGEATARIESVWRFLTSRFVHASHCLLSLLTFPRGGRGRPRVLAVQSWETLRKRPGAAGRRLPSQALAALRRSAPPLLLLLPSQALAALRRSAPPLPGPGRPPQVGASPPPPLPGPGRALQVGASPGRK